MTVAEAMGREQAASPRPAWQAVFRLARRLAAVGGFDPDAADDVLRRYAAAAGVSAAGVVNEFPARWAKVRMPVGYDPLTWAAALARRRPVRLAGIPPDHVFLVSLGYHLSRMVQPRPFQLPLQRLGPVLRPDLPAETVAERARLRQIAKRALDPLLPPPGEGGPRRGGIGVFAFANGGRWSKQRREARDLWFVGSPRDEGPARAAPGPG